MFNADTLTFQEFKMNEPLPLSVIHEAILTFEGNRLAQAGVDPGEDGEHDGDGLGRGLAGKPGCEGDAGFSFVENEDRPGSLADDEIALPMAGLGAGVDGFRPIVDRGSVPDRVA
jgi:hypothetical protein